MANIKQVAALAKLSVSCVSKYLKDPNSVLPSSRESIETAINELNYVPSAIARNLRTKRTGIIKIMSHSIINPYCAEFFELFRKQLEKYNLISILQVIDFNKNINFGPEDFEQVDGIILNSIENDKVLFSLSKAAPPNFPLVFIHGYKPVDTITTIVIDVKKGSRLATDYLVSLGCKNLAYIGGPAESIISKLKFSGFTEAIASVSNVTCSAVFRSPTNVSCSSIFHESDFDAGIKAVDEMLGYDNLPDGIVCESDALAAGVIQSLTKRSIQIPNQIHVTGYDNTPISSMIFPQLTTVAIPSEEACEIACKELMALLNNNEAESHTFSPKLLIRNS